MHDTVFLGTVLCPVLSYRKRFLSHPLKYFALCVWQKARRTSERRLAPMGQELFTAF